MEKTNVEETEKKCEGAFEGKKYELLESWLEKDTFECTRQEGEDEIPERSRYKVKLYYKYNELSFDKDTCEVVKKEVTATSSTTVTCTNDGNMHKNMTYTTIELPNGERKPINFSYVCNECKGRCKKDAVIEVGNITYDVISYDKDGEEKKNITHSDHITCSGYTSEVIDGVERCYNEVNYTAEYVRYDRDEECNKTRREGVYHGIWRPNACSSDECCSSHYVTTSVTETIEDKEVTFGLSIIMKGDTDKVYAKDCECKPNVIDTTYEVDSNNVEVYYPIVDAEGNKQWVKDGKVSRDGGEVKVVFTFTAYTKQIECSAEVHEISSVGVHEEIIDVPKCSCPNDDGCVGTLSGEIEFKTPHTDYSNILIYEVKQETCE